MANALIALPLPLAAVTASATDIGDPAYVGLDYPGVVWRSTSAAGATLTLDLGADAALDTILLFGVEAPADATWQIDIATAAQGGFAGAYWSGDAGTLFAGSVLPVSGRGVTFWAAPAGAPATGRYVRLTFAASADFVIEISRAVISQAIRLERNFGFGGKFGVRDLGSLDFSARGVLLRRRGAKLRTTALTFSSIHKDEAETMMLRLLERIGNTEMIALLTDPAEDPQRQNRAYFGPLVGDLSHAWRKANLFEASVNLVSVF